MSNDTKPETTWTPECPKCRETAHVIDERRERLVSGERVRLVLTCQNAHSWAAEYFAMNPSGGESNDLAQD